MSPMPDAYTFPEDEALDVLRQRSRIQNREREYSAGADAPSHITAKIPKGEEWNPWTFCLHHTLSETADVVSSFKSFEPLVSWFRKKGTVYDEDLRPEHVSLQEQAESIRILIRQLQRNGVKIREVDRHELLLLHKARHTKPSTWNYVDKRNNGSTEIVADPFVYFHEQDEICVPIIEQYSDICEVLDNPYTFEPTPQDYVRHILHEMAARLWLIMTKGQKQDTNESNPLHFLAQAGIGFIESGVYKRAGKDETARYYRNSSIFAVNQAID